MRLGVLGGTFDPVHAGHLAVARAARRHLRLDRVLLVPARLSPLKSRRPAASRHRLAMLRLAVRGIRWISIEGMELRRPAPSYTVDTLQALRRRWPKAELFLLVGADACRDLSRWHRAGEILRLAAPVAFPRPGFRLPAGFRRLPMIPRPVSSTAIRKALAAGGRPRGCPPAAAAYALARKLY